MREGRLPKALIQLAIPNPSMSAADANLQLVLKTHWGFDRLRPLQREAIDAVLAGRDSVVVLPTGGGKSLCYQAPAMLLPGLAVVVSPLISLMKDQVDALKQNGIPAAAVHSMVSLQEKRRIADEIRSGRLKLLYVAPERLMSDKMMSFLSEQTISFFAIDEAHCISNWGHEFRPEYRMLGQLRQRFSGVGIHGYTATATPQVQTDIAEQLRLQNVERLVGAFDRPNLLYRVLRRANAGRQIQEVFARHANESGIVYCISRKEVDSLSLALRTAGVKAAAYHAGLSDDERRRNQDDFLAENVDVIVATVAFGMGIDKSNVRFVFHTGAPKSLEHYQQETGRAGRDGLESECCLLFGGNDFHIWRKMNDELSGDALAQFEANLRSMESYCASVSCRHRMLVEHFGQRYERENCGACDVCLDQQDCLPDALVVSQKILSCVLRVNENFGADYVAQVLTGSRDQRILANQHEQLSTHGLLKEHHKTAVRQWIDQLSGQDFLTREGEYRVLKVTASGRELLKGKHAVRLLAAAPQRKASREATPRKQFTEGMDAGLFEALRQLRKQVADEQHVPAFVVFGDVTLQDLARRRPTSVEAFHRVHGVGDRKADQYGARFVAEIARYCVANGVEADVTIAEDEGATENAAAPIKPIDLSKNATKAAAAALFREGRSIAEVCASTDRAASTVSNYLAEFLAEEGRQSPEPWVDDALFARIAAAAEITGVESLKPIFEQLGGEVSYNDIRLCVACLRNAKA
jgi:ATP-dependent DNA helicase RecQ